MDGAAAGLKTPAYKYMAFMKKMAFMKNNSVQDELIERFKLQESYEKKVIDYICLALIINTLENCGNDGLIMV